MAIQSSSSHYWKGSRVLPWTSRRERPGRQSSVPTKAPGLTMWASRATTATQHQPRLDLSQIRSLGQGMLMCFSGKLASHVLLSLIYGSEIKNFCCCCCLWDIRAAMFCTAGQQSPIVVIIIPMERRFVTGGFVMLSTKLLWTRLDQPF